MVSLWFIILFAVIVALSAIVGLVRGLNKSVIRLMTLVLAVILTFVIAGPITSAVARNIQMDGQTLGQMLLESLRGEATVAQLLEAAPLLREAILVLPAFAMAIVIFPVAFCTLSFITWIVFLFVQKPLRKLIFKDSCNKEEDAQKPRGVRIGKRFAGMGVGIVTGMLVFAMVITPVLGLFTMLPEKSAMNEALDMMAMQSILSEEDAQSLQDAYAVTGSPLVNFYNMVGIASAGRTYLNSVSKIESNGQVTCLADEFSSLFSMVQTAIKGGLVNALLSPEDPTAIYKFLADKEALDALMQDMFQSRLLRSAVSEVMAVAVESVAGNMQIPANKAAVYNNMMDNIALAVKDAQIDYASITAYESANSIARNFARSFVCQETDPDKALMTQEEYEAEVQKLIELAQTISAILDKSIAGDNKAFTDSVADQIVNQVKTQASENEEEALANFDAASVQDAISNIDPDSIDATNAGQLLEQLADQEKFETDMATVETIAGAIRESVNNAFADESKATETASTLASVVSDLAAAVSEAVSENGEMDMTKLDFDKLADAVTTLQNSTLKDVGASVLDIVASGDLGDNSMASDALGAMKDGYEQGEDVGGAISSTGALIGLSSAMNSGETDQETMVNSMTSLINNLNEFTISLLPSILTSDTLASMGVPAEHTDAAYDVVETLLKELMQCQGAQAYDNEVNATLVLLDLAITGADGFAAEDIPTLASCADASDAIYNTLMSVSVSNPFGVEIPNEESRSNLAAAIEENFAISDKSQKDLDIHNAIAILLGLDAEVELG